MRIQAEAEVVMRIFVTGAAGPLGRALTSGLRRRGDAVVGQVRRRNGVDVLRNLGLQGGYVAVFGAAAWARFGARDITS